VIAWKTRGWGHGHANPIAMCVHYGMVFVSLAAALGHSARGVAATHEINGPHGHFMAEIWDAARKKWVLHDPNYDLHYVADRGLLSAVELADWAHGDRPAAKIVSGRPVPHSPALRKLLADYLATGRIFTAMGVWRRNDVVSDPAAAPPSHGSVIYVETDFVWYTPVSVSAMPMFPSQTSDVAYFGRGPRRPRRAPAQSGKGAACR
jgi:hypothetical protein